jgi:hypothetical protein
MSALGTGSDKPVCGFLLVLAVGAGCSDGRPAIAEWRNAWDDLEQSIPDRSSFADGPDQELCSDTLVSIRTQEPGVLPTPDAALDDIARDWLALARETFYECPPGTNVQGFDEAFAEVDAFRAEMDAGIAVLDR